MRQFRTVFKFEYTNYVKTKGYIAVTALMLALILVVTSLPAITGLFDNIFGKEAESGETSGVSESGVSGEAGKKALLADAAGLFDNGTLNAYLPGYTWTRVNDLTGAQEEMENGDIMLALKVDGLKYTLYEKGESIFAGNSSYAVSEMIKQMYITAYLADRGLTPNEVIEVMSVETAGEVITVGKDVAQTFWLSYVVLFLMYMVILLYGQFVSTSVVTEKSTKAMELLVTSAKPFQLMFGKVLGVGAAGLTQFVLILLGAVGFFRLNYNGWMEFSPMVAALLDMSVSGGIALYAVLFFLLGFFSFAFIYAGFASTVSRMEDANSVMMFPMFMFVAAFMVAIFGSMNPTASYVTVCSFVPFLSPLVMFMRICATDVSMIEVLIAIAINVATVLGAAFVASRIYKVGVMLYGKKPNLKDIIKYIAKA